MTESIVEVKQGKLRGTIRENIDGGKYFSFRGIPFAEPPVRELRFKDPIMVKPWSGIKDALEESKISAQFDFVSNTFEGGDDCLYLDVATNSLHDKKPVMVWIHGGAFKRSSNTYKKYGPDYLIKKDIVFVSLNYRLGILGFLNMEHEECPGNQGLKDAMLALKWVKENIESFGGDSENVTIFGESAGSAIVNFMCLSPKAKGLFHKAILQSGVLTNPWANISSNKEQVYNLVKAFGKELSDPLEVIQFLRTIPVQDLIEKYEYLNKMKMETLRLYLIPSLDNNIKDPILPISPFKLQDNGIDVPVIIGYNSHEGISIFGGKTDDFINDMNNSVKNYIAETYRLNSSETEQLSEAAEAIREFYFGKDEINIKKLNEIVEFYGDLHIVYNIIEVLNIQRQKTSPTYFYIFSYQPDYPTIKNSFKMKIQGSSHADELGCLFCGERRVKKLPEGTRDRKTMERMTTMWTNFAKFGNPTPVTNELITTKWLPIDKSKFNYLNIGDDLTSDEYSHCFKWTLWKPYLECLLKKS